MIFRNYYDNLSTFDTDNGIFLCEDTDANLNVKYRLHYRGKFGGGGGYAITYVPIDVTNYNKIRINYSYSATTSDASSKIYLFNPPVTNYRSNTCLGNLPSGTNATAEFDISGYSGEKFFIVSLEHQHAPTRLEYVDIYSIQFVK